MVTHTLNSCSAFNPSKVHTHSSEHTHTLNTHPERWVAFYAAAPGEQLWVLAQGHLSRGIEGRESAVHSLPPPTIPAGPRLELSITSPTIKPRLPQKVTWLWLQEIIHEQNHWRVLDLIPLCWRAWFVSEGLQWVVIWGSLCYLFSSSAGV